MHASGTVRGDLRRDEDGRPMTTPGSQIPYVPGRTGQPPAPWPGGTMVRVGEIGFDDTTVYTPVGNLDRYRTHWTLGGATPVSESCPNWAQALAIVLIPCTGFLSLLFLLMKETDSWSSTLRVTDGRITFDTMVYSRSRSEYLGIRNVVAWAQRPPQPPPGQTGRFALPSAP